MQADYLVLEEYVELLRTKGRLTATVDEQVYEVRYYPYMPGMTVPIPKDTGYRLSGDNRGGIIVTIGPN